MGDITKMNVSKRTLHLINKLEPDEAGKRNVVSIPHDSFLLFLCALYMQVRGDDRVLVAARKRAERYAKGEDL